MHRLLILSRLARDYSDIVEAAHLPDLSITAIDRISADAPGARCRSTSRSAIRRCSRQVLPALTGVRWIQSTWAGVEPLLDPALRRDYVLTNARGVFGAADVRVRVRVSARARAEDLREAGVRRRQAAGITTPPTRLRGKQSGLLGVGTIGAALARTAKHFGMRVKGYTRASEDSADVDEYFHGSLADVGAAFALRPRLPGERDARHRGDASRGGRRAASRAAAARCLRQSRTRQRRGRSGAGRRAAGRAARRRRARRVRRPSRCRRTTCSGGCRTCTSPRTPRR